MTIEQKAKRYDETLKAAVVAHKDEDRHLKAALERIFPELKESEESEDEIIKKAIKYGLDYVFTNNTTVYETTKEQCLAWLEKQGEHVEINPTEFDTRLQALIGKFETLPKEELVGSLSFWLNVVQNDGTYKADEKQDKQNPCETCSSPRLNCQNFPCEKKKNFDFSNKVEPKFKVGDWIVDNCGYVWKIEGILNQFYLLEGVEGGESRPTIEWVDKTFHLWTIQDAKDGDVLACESGWTCIFKEFNHNSFGEILFDSYCFIDRTGWFCDGAKGHTLNERINGKIYPATKEQRDTLMKAITDAGYTFDFEKKELKKL